MSLDYDKYCHCIMCGQNLRLEKVIGGKIEYVLSNNYDTIAYRLNDSSEMRVCVCKLCKPTVTDEHSKMIMEKVYKGWINEIDNSKVQWPEEKRQAYIDRYSKLFIKQKEN